MICPNCGRAFEGSSCPECSSAAAVGIPESASHETASTLSQTLSIYQKVDPAQPSSLLRIVGRHNVRGYDVIRRLARSPWFLIGVIAYTGSCLCSVLGSLHLFNDPPLPGEFQTVFFGGLLLTILTTVGLWITFSATGNRSDGKMTTAGLTMIKVAMFLELALFGILSLFAFFYLTGSSMVSLFNGFADLSELMDGGSHKVGSALWVLICLLLSGVLVLFVVYMVKIISLINLVSGVFRTGVPDTKVSGFVAVMNFLIAASLLQSTLGSFDTDTWLSTLGTVSQAVSYIAFGVCIFRLRAAMQAVARSDF